MVNHSDDILKLEKQVKSLKKCCCANGGGTYCCYEEVTYAEAAAKIAANTLIKGKMYKITDRGDLGIFLEAISENQFNQEGSRLMLIPNWKCYSAFRIYLSTASYVEGDHVIWDGKVWENLTSANTHKPGEGVTDWVEIPKAVDTQSTQCAEGVMVYVENWFGVIYDFANDWISKQWDDRGNVFGISYDLSPVYFVNPVDISDWWIAQGFNFELNNTRAIFNNECYGIWNNAGKEGGDAYIIQGNRNMGAIYENVFSSNHIQLTGINNNLNNGSIYANIIDGNIHLNSNVGEISDNVSPVTDIGHNTNVGFITSNSNEGEITFNSNIGNITTNSNLGVISYNSNGGSIDTCDSTINPCDIKNNINNGNISGTYAADVTDPIVNK